MNVSDVGKASYVMPKAYKNASTPGTQDKYPLQTYDSVDISKTAQAMMQKKYAIPEGEDYAQLRLWAMGFEDAMKEMDAQEQAHAGKESVASVGAGYMTLYNKISRDYTLDSKDRVLQLKNIENRYINIMKQRSETEGWEYTDKIEREYRKSIQDMGDPAYYNEYIHLPMDAIIEGNYEKAVRLEDELRIKAKKEDKPLIEEDDEEKRKREEKLKQLAEEKRKSELLQTLQQTGKMKDDPEVFAVDRDKVLGQLGVEIEDTRSASQWS